MSMLGVLASAIPVVAAGWVAYTFNRCIRQRNLVREAWSGVDVQLKRRHDLVPRLVDCVKGYKGYEAALLERLAHSRSQAQAVRSVAESGVAEGGLARDVQALLAVAEAYPDLKASQTFLGLSTALIEVEDQIQYARRYYNGTVRDFNTLVESFPSSLVARGFAFRAAEFFEVEASAERNAMEVRL